MEGLISGEAQTLTGRRVLAVLDQGVGLSCGAGG